MTWALKRQLFYIGILTVVFGGLGFVIGYPYFDKDPTCFDGKKNGTETGIDCGGSCALACYEQVDNISILWARSFRVVPGRYNAIAYIQNHNETELVNRIRYRFRFADENNVYIGMREGQTFIPASGKFAIFEPAIGLGNSVPVYTTFEFLESPVWYQVPDGLLDQYGVRVRNVELENQATTPKLTATIENTSLYEIEDIDVVAILYDSLGNALQTSETNIELLRGEGSEDVYFTWQEPISQEIVSKEIIPLIDFYKVKFK